MTKEYKQYEVLKRASLFLQKNNCEIQVAEILLQHFLQLSRTQFYTNMQNFVPQEVKKQFFQALQKHVTTKIPIQHLTGYEYFYGRKFHVNEHVLIPRPETEELVAKVIEMIQQKKRPDSLRIADLGTGSGVIAITLALELKNVKVYATDISKKALKVASKNAKKHQANVHFLAGDFAKPLIARDIQTEVIVSNPPYISFAEKPKLSPTVQHDPKLALFAPKEGLAAYETIVQQSKSVLKKSGIIAFEIGHQQGKAVQQIVHKSYPESLVKIYQDINGHDRIVLAKGIDHEH